MKKNKKYWKREAKSWREIAEMETESANHWAGETMIVAEELDELRVKFMKLKDELHIVRQYNIGKPNPNWPNTGKPYGTFTAGYDNINLENNVVDMWKNKWSKNTPSNLSNFSVPPKKCNCKNCDCDK